MTRMYDMRTWEMYLRITEARRKSASPAAAACISHQQPITTRLHNNKFPPVKPESAPIDGFNSQHEDDDETDLELVFGDLDE